MSSCSLNSLSLYLDGALSLPELRRLESHLAGCPKCRDELQTLRRLDRVITEWGARRTPMPAAAQFHVSRSLERRRRLGPLARASRVMPAAVGTSVAALLVVLSVNLGVLVPTQRGVAVPSYSQAAAQRLARQSAPLVDARRSSAILGGHAVTPAARASVRRQQLGIS
ncbi:MAG TPA: zf-HC2 domain-containing protein [Chloroflexota bacterium]|nr:zf-HC2 domain-containing protein [Chloroflexota bacterium]